MKNFFGKILFAVFALCMCKAWDAHAEEKFELKTIIVSVQTRSFAELERLKQSIALAPSASAVVPKGSTPSKVISQLYGIGPTNSPAAYDAIQRKIFELNGVVDEKSLKAGKIIVPDMPKLTSRTDTDLVEEKLTIAKNTSKIIAQESLGGIESGVDKTYESLIKIKEPLRRSINYLRAEILASEQAKELLKQADEVGAIYATGSEAQINLSANEVDCADINSKFLSDDEVASIQTALKDSPRNKERYLLVFDTGWPTYEDRQRSLEFLRKAFDDVRKAIQLKSTDMPVFSTTSPGAFSPPDHPHSCMIRQSMLQTRSIDAQGLIKIIYIPLRPGQIGAQDYFRELLALSQLVKAKGAEVFSRAPTANEIQLANTFASASLSSTSTLSTPWKRDQNMIAIYEPLISGLLQILNAYAKIDLNMKGGRPSVDVKFFLSTSWNFTNYTIAPELPHAFTYMVFAAAGNDGADFIVSQRLFASHALTNRQIVAVMNSDLETGYSTCSTAVFNDIWNSHYSASAVVSFPGRLSSDRESSCPGLGGGTSFSTPRLAWIAAVSELSNPTTQLSWQNEISERLVSSRSKVQGDFKAAPVSIKKLLSLK
ncbi:hypothetical protein [Massilia suwonensis]|uniref:Peptidase S8/S53 domain-containing protein n=1 Tax=Massilia suwonensis TaxID=648895 RepID=A0ABW0MLA9_9BURK